MIKHDLNEGVKGFTVGREKVEVSHLPFADDILFFLEAQQCLIKNLEVLLRVICVALGLKVNMSKSTLLGKCRGLCARVGYGIRM